MSFLKKIRKFFIGPSGTIIDEQFEEKFYSISSEDLNNMTLDEKIELLFDLNGPWLISNMKFNNMKTKSYAKYFKPEIKTITRKSLKID